MDEGSDQVLYCPPRAKYGTVPILFIIENGKKAGIMQLPSSADYLSWARDTYDRMRAEKDVYDLFTSNMQEPTELILRDMARVIGTNGGSNGTTSDLSGRIRDQTAWGNAHLLNGVLREYNIEQEPGYDKQRVLLTSGASMAFVVVVQGLVEVGDHVIVERPYYHAHVRALQARGAEITFIERVGDNYTLDLNWLEAHVTPDTRLIALTNLHNPSSALLDDELLGGVLAIAKRVGAKVVVDEIYYDFVAQAPVATLDDTFISISGIGKVYGLGALRCGWIVAAPEVIKQLRPAHIVFDNSNSAILQAISSVVFDHLSDYRAAAEAVLAKNRPVIAAWAEAAAKEGLISGTLQPNGCTFFPRLNGINSVEAFSQMLASERGVVVVPGRYFGSPAHVRIAFGQLSPERLETALNHLSEALRTFRGLL